ncbi:MAG: hydroxymethylbilane synthase [Bryobacteraceae bacterium]|nr:hydroxymethylbilane synthase [Bryobacteraceae bacterium]MDW8378692.1 hydroxymethylbilane synthase [Bryobacterales bacterium]
MLVIGSRGSKLALWQAAWVKAKLEASGHSCAIEIIHTTGDRISDVPLANVGTKGIFIKEIEEALLDGSIDLAVHSLKDMPTELPSGLMLAATPTREDPRDALIGCKLAELGKGARVGTSSLRRAAQLRALRPDLQLEPVRGNLDTRLKKLEQGQYDAMVLAAAGLRRLGWEDRIAQLFEPELMCPAVGQGALAIETRNDGGTGQQACELLDDVATRRCVTAERALLAALGGGCQVPLGAYARLQGERLELQAVIVSPDGATMVRRSAQGMDALALGEHLARELLEAGGREILESVFKT